MLNLPQVTLCCVDTRLPDMALDAMKKCIAQIQFGEALLFTRSNHGLQNVPNEIKVIAVDTIKSVEDYSHFMVKGLQPHLRTSHLLIVQWDGYVIDPAMWSTDFLEFDYIGAVWPQFKDAHRVGNGGFSLRSRKLLDALSRDNIKPAHPEDICIARTYRAQLEQQCGIRFADEAVAHRFAFERDRRASKSFGFHGLANMVDLLSTYELTLLLDKMPPSVFKSVEARGFIKKLMEKNLDKLAKSALIQRKKLKRISVSDVRLWIRIIYLK